ncbi:MAG: bifunctional diaminohydroxyphosphoribosylaminopyrimidine deaminase/5-amino-6-(5-phosphoribosylamino)uracil reductase RibD [Fretibacterium sp.]|nr:bifunctional diaminohydroxyphosphoribosylaminopyrimidine deaminase/5-amino-6-(5-phosphoribosylamino)uracil reductase RibD [Fretibacterium sp.]
MKEIVSRETDEYYMKRALSLAARGMGTTSPNPMVGCVLVRDSRIIGEGYHQRCGGDHAEIKALKDASSRGEDVQGATAYVTLEPCCHFGRTPPCAQRLVEEGITRVVAATSDPNPKVKGGGLAVLREAGIEVSFPCLEAEARWLNRGFIRVQMLGRPWVTLKAAVSLDGRMALSNGESKWITGPEARTEAHQLRASHDAVLVGVGTVLKDNPELTVRHVDGRSPRRVILDSYLRTPPDVKAVTGEGGCLILTVSRDEEKISSLQSAGATVICLPADREGHVDLSAAMSCLAQEGILSLMVEGGPRVLTAFMKKGLCDWLSLFVAPKVMGEGSGLGMGMYFTSVAEALTLKNLQSRSIGSDLLIEGRFACSPDL